MLTVWDTSSTQACVWTCTILCRVALIAGCVFCESPYFGETGEHCSQHRGGWGVLTGGLWYFSGPDGLCPNLLVLFKTNTSAPRV